MSDREPSDVREFFALDATIEVIFTKLRNVKILLEKLAEQLSIDGDLNLEVHKEKLQDLINQIEQIAYSKETKNVAHLLTQNKSVRPISESFDGQINNILGKIPINEVESIDSQEELRLIIFKLVQSINQLK